MVAVSITKERTPAELRVLARRERDGRVGARLLALANALDGMGRGEAARAHRAAFVEQAASAPPKRVRWIARTQNLAGIALARRRLGLAAL